MRYEGDVVYDKIEDRWMKVMAGENADRQNVATLVYHVNKLL